jgi:hypothetical protein
MRRSTILAAGATILGALIFCPEVNATEPSVWQYLYPGTKTIVGIDWQRAKGSPTGKMIARHLAQSGDFKAAAQGTEILELIDRVLISTSGRPVADGQRVPPAVIAIQGRLSREVLLKVAPKGTAVQKFKGADLFVPFNSKADEPLVALINEQFAVMGDRESLALVLDGQGSVEQELMARALQMASECEIFIVSRESFADAAGASPEGPQGMKQLQDIEAVDLGISLAKGLGLKGAITSKDPASAQSLAMMAQLFTTMAASDPKQANSELGKIARSLKVSTEGKTVHLSLDIPVAQLERGVVQMKASAKEFGAKTLESLVGVSPKPGSIPGLRPAASPQLAQASAPQVTGQPPVRPQQPAQPVKRTIKIVGLDSGDKEITYQSAGAQR